MEPENVVVVVKNGLVSEVYSGNANEKIIVVDLDLEKDRIHIFDWPETQYDDERVEELLNLN